LDYGKELQRIASEPPYVSIIVVNYEGYRWLRSFMDQLIHTSYPAFEVIVVDNGSQDGSVEFLREHFKQVRIVKLSENKGFAHGVNIGAKEANGDVLAFLNNDVEVTPHWLSEAVIGLYSEDNIGAVQCKMKVYGSKDKIDCVGLSIDRYNVAVVIGQFETDTGQYDDLSEVGAFSGGAILIRKDTFYKIGGCDETYFMYFEDVDLSWRLRLSGYQIKPVHTSLVYHVGAGSSGIIPSGTSERIWNPSPFFAFEMTKNYLYCWLKNSKSKTIVCYSPVIACIVLSMCLLAIIRGRPRTFVAHIKGIIWILLHSKIIYKKRTAIEKLRNGQSDDILFVRQTAKGSTNLSFGIRKMLSMMRKATRRSRG